MKGNATQCPYCGSKNILVTLAMHPYRPKEIDAERVKCFNCKQSCWVAGAVYK